MSEPSAVWDPSIIEEVLLVLKSEERGDINDKVDKICGSIEIDSKLDVVPPGWHEDDTGDNIVRTCVKTTLMPSSGVSTTTIEASIHTVHLTILFVQLPPPLHYCL